MWCILCGEVAFNGVIAHGVYTMRKLTVEIINERLLPLNLQLAGEYKNSRLPVKIKCYCGNIFETQLDHVFSGHTKSCGCFRKQNPNGYKGTKNIGLRYIGQILNNCKRRHRNIDFDLDIQYLQQLLEEQDFKCKLSGLPISDKEIGVSKRNSVRTFSLDRIDSKVGYVKGNVQWVHKTVQKMKMDLSQEEFINFCKIIADNAK